MGQCLRIQAQVIEPPVKVKVKVKVTVKLPWELEKEILSRLPPQSLVRFRSVCKQWNYLFNKDKGFLNNHFSRSRPQLIFLANAKVYSIDIINLIDQKSIDPKIELRELPSFDIPYEDAMIYTAITTCDEFLFCNYQFWKDGTALWNPWLRQVKLVEYEFKDIYDSFFYVSGLGYDNSGPEKVYKVLGYIIRKFQGDSKVIVVIYDCASHTFKLIDTPAKAKRRIVSLNGNLYWVACNLETSEYFIRSFDFSTETFKHICFLPYRKNNHPLDQYILAVYKEDRFSLLKQWYRTRKIEIWVMKKHIDKDEEVVWIKLMSSPTTNFPRLFHKFGRISYLICDKTLFMCCNDEIPGATDNEFTGVACIYIVREDLCKKIQIGSGFTLCCHCVYTPSLISLPFFRS